MTLSEFNSLELSQKADLVWEWGHYLASRKDNKYNVALFLTGNFFAQVYISTDKNTTEKIEGVAAENLPAEMKALLNYNDPFLKVLTTKTAGTGSRKA